jgi:PhoH-like ATPase
MNIIKKVILDTNIIMDSPLILSELKNTEILLSIAVLEELDRNKSRYDEGGKSIRSFIRILEEIRKTGNLKEGAEYHSNIVKFVNLDPSKELDLPAELKLLDKSIDNLLLATCKQTPDAIFLTNDILLRIKAENLGIKVEEYTRSEIDGIKNIYSGAGTIVVTREQIDYFHSEGELELDSVLLAKKSVMPNQCLVLKCDENESQSAIGRYRHDIQKIVPIFPIKEIFGLQAKNKEQQFALDLLFDKGVQLVTLTGPSGGGKTLCAIAAGLQQVMGDNASYEKLIIIRPIEPVGKDIGFLPGSLEEKLEPWIAPIKDNLNQLFGQKPTKKAKKSDEPYLSILIEKGIIEIQAMTYIRGRSIPNAFIIIDECQNTTKNEIKTIITRAGHGTKIILTGDLEQLDNYKLDMFNNGLAHAIEKFKHLPIAGHVSLTKGVRSELATTAAEIL